MMAERHRLRALQVREAGHHGRGMHQRLLRQRLLIVAEQAMDVVDAVAHPEPEVGRDLIVARARGVQPPGRRANQLGEPALDIHVNVLKLALELELAGADL